jgi:hypothetical protein
MRYRIATGVQSGIRWSRPAPFFISTQPCETRPGSGAFLQADARTRTGDPFITSELQHPGGVGCLVAGNG